MTRKQTTFWRCTARFVEGRDRREVALFGASFPSASRGVVGFLAVSRVVCGVVSERLVCCDWFVDRWLLPFTRGRLSSGLGGGRNTARRGRFRRLHGLGGFGLAGRGP